MIKENTYNRLLYSKTLLRRKLQYIFILSTFYISLLNILCIVSILNSDTLIDAIPIIILLIAFLPIYLILLYRKLIIYLYKRQPQNKKNSLI